MSSSANKPRNLLSGNIGLLQRTRRALFSQDGHKSSLQSGFTLVELAAVVLLIGLILALGLPSLVPAIAFGELEGSARHLAGYGRALMAHCAFTHEPVTFRVDLDAGEYWAMRWVYAQETDAASVDGGFQTPVSGTDADLAWRAQEMADRFQRFTTLAMQARARGVKKDGILSDLEPLFEKEFDLEWDEAQNEEEIKTELLLRTRLPKDVRLESVRIGVTEYTSGVAETVVTALGLSETVQFVLVSGGEYMTVEWDAITGSSHLRAGREEAADL